MMAFTPCKCNCKSFHNEDLEITRNPFDSKDFDKENCPAFSPSIFVNSVRQGSSEKKNKGFRWSIDQIAVLRPAEIEEFPYQEYSVSYEREEDEVAAQNAINEYFAKATLPSPWMRNKDHSFKRVTFSPHPPTYFKESPDDSSKISANSSQDSQNGESKKLVNSSCQTTLTIPPDIDLEKTLGNFFTYKEENKPNKELNVSSLRRKLFSQGEPSPSKEIGVIEDDEDLCVEIKGLGSVNSTPKTPRTPNWITSSPFKDITPSNRFSSSNDSVKQSSFVAEPFASPVVSPIKDTDDDDDNKGSTLGLSEESMFYPRYSLGDSFQKSKDQDCARDFGIKELDLPKCIGTVSIEPYDSVVDIKESTRCAPKEIPGVSPIKYDQGDAMDISMGNSSRYYAAMNVSELPDFSQSVKESTASNLHGMTGLFSPIRGGRKTTEIAEVYGEEEEQGDAEEPSKDPDVSFDDGGPLDITDLSLPDNADKRNEFPDEDDQSGDPSDDVFCSPIVIVSPFPTPKRGILKHKSSTLNKNKVDKEAAVENYLKDKFHNLEYKLHEVENRLESVENAYDKSKGAEVKREVENKVLADVKRQDSFRINDNEISNDGSSFYKTPEREFPKDVARKPLSDVVNRPNVNGRSPSFENMSLSIDSEKQKRNEITPSFETQPLSNITNKQTFNEITPSFETPPLSNVTNKQNISERSTPPGNTSLVDVTNIKDYLEMFHTSQQSKKDNFNMESVVTRADAALSKAKQVQSCIDGDFELYLEESSNGDSRVNDRESCEVARITGGMGGNDVNGDLYESGFRSKGILESSDGRFKEYRLDEHRDSFNDSWDLRCRTANETREIESPLFSHIYRQTRVPTPVMNLSGLSIYTANKENKIPYSLPRPATSERKWPLEGIKSERRHTWPSMKSQRSSTSYHGRPSSPCFPSRYRAPKSSPFIKQDTANKIKDEWRVRSSTRNSFLSNFR